MNISIMAPSSQTVGINNSHSKDNMAVYAKTHRCLEEMDMTAHRKKFCGPIVYAHGSQAEE